MDLCFALRVRGLKIIYEPRSRIRHMEFSSTEEHFRHFLFHRNRRRLCEKWPTQLADCEPPPAPEDWDAAIARAVHRARVCPRHIPVIDDFYPEAALGSACPRCSRSSRSSPGLPR